MITHGQTVENCLQSADNETDEGKRAELRAEAGVWAVLAVAEQLAEVAENIGRIAYIAENHA